MDILYCWKQTENTIYSTKNSLLYYQHALGHEVPFYNQQYHTKMYLFHQNETLSFTFVTRMTQKNIQSTRVTLTSLLLVTQTKFIFPSTVEHQLSECQSFEPPPVKKKLLCTFQLLVTTLKYHTTRSVKISQKFKIECRL